MAERISKIKRIEKSEAEIKEAHVDEVTTAISENKDSIIKAIKLVKALDDAKILDGLTGAVNERYYILDKFANELNKDQYAGMIHNIGQFALLLGEFNPEDLKVILDKFNRGIHVANEANPNKTTSIGGFMSLLRDEEANRSITYFINMLKGMSREK
ncbi:DUF1641 domain-containing protein [Staphylococcus massiliensis]|uniref:DUF1641 domain-containing protein n=1 Tax=Staphylococcus massiliensis S46 TaxID=1229783 RepID=K9B2H3_9STAP|nr:DUF1641 domain-containing protein [Staphylococcus massiliensis]EKU48982.1 hypothetical protein C273_04225 [Staphylococcus massiliensis S46]MCG3399422.1 DUF1641 domain-containing protein [Staphylococcus massiliensis]MCG3402478.1 DUF1641 domain-containing protein [Staphylococcus massiliensis]MCG3411558.1 DUF1641 domain-containing protein [Staphylococcus massiliensis]PNZ97603.1 DUF1641 domain-containing protein [Staphylococcus massiliensis CCUG 55927]